MKASELSAGQVINYRGNRAEVLECWTSPTDKDAERFTLDGAQIPASATIQWTDEQGEKQRCRLLFTSTEDTTCDGMNGQALELME